MSKVSDFLQDVVDGKIFLEKDLFGNTTGPCRIWLETSSPADLLETFSTWIKNTKNNFSCKTGDKI